jgi:ABC-type cobalamin/Fe3+-siderophores transport system ATPase subunit
VLPARDNPFAVHRVLRERYRLEESGWRELLARLEARRWRGAIVGPHGAGKTTLLEDLAARLEAAGWSVRWVRLSAEIRTFRSEALRGLSGREIVVVDGAEQLGWIRWMLLRWRVRRSGGLIVTTHRAGRLATVHRCETTPALLCQLAVSLGVMLAPAQAVALHARHRGNIREALRELYDAHAAGAFGAVRTGG